MLIECELTSLKLAIELLPNTTTEEEGLLHLSHFDENHREAAMANKSHNKRVKAKYDRYVHPHVFIEGYLT